jgi:hypothetical protein
MAYSANELPVRLEMMACSQGALRCPCGKDATLRPKPRSPSFKHSFYAIWPGLEVWWSSRRPRSSSVGSTRYACPLRSATLAGCWPSRSNRELRRRFWHCSSSGWPYCSVVLFAPQNFISAVTLTLCAVAVAGAIGMVLELERGFGGLIRVSPRPMRQAVAELKSHEVDFSLWRETAMPVGTANIRK